MVDTVDSVEEHSGVNPISSTGDGGTSVSREEFNVALETLKTSMTTEVESMFTKFIEGLKLSTASLKVGDPTDKVTDANSDKGEASSEKAPSSSGKNGIGIFAHVEPPLVYGGPVPSTHLNHASPPPKIVKNEDFDSWVYRFMRHLNHVNISGESLKKVFIRMTKATSPLEKPRIINSMRMLSSSFKMQFHPKTYLIFVPSPWPKMHGIVSCLSTGEAQAFNAPTMKWYKMRPMSLQ